MYSKFGPEGLHEARGHWPLRGVQHRRGNVAGFRAGATAPEPAVVLASPLQALHERALLALRRRPLTSTKQLKELSGLSFPTAGKALEILVNLGIARELTGGRRNRLFAYDAYLAILSEGTEPL